MKLRGAVAGTNLAGRLAAVLAMAVLAFGTYGLQQQWRYWRAWSRGQAARASEVWPANAEAWRNQAQSLSLEHPTSAYQAAEKAVADDPQDWNNWAVLASAQYLSGDLRRARQSMEQVQRAHGFEPEWRYANLLLATGDAAGFWANATRAVANVGDYLFDDTFESLLADTQGNFEPLAQAVRNAQVQQANAEQSAELGAQYLEFLLGHSQWRAAAPWWEQALASARRHPSQEGILPRLGLEYLDGYLETGVGTAAERNRAACAIWEEGRDAGVFGQEVGPHDGQWVSNPDFDDDAGLDSLDWATCAACGPWIERVEGGAGTRSELAVTFRGDQEDDITIATQRLLLVPDTRYRFQYEARAAAASPDTGVNAAVLQDGRALVQRTARLGVEWTTQGGDFHTSSQGGRYDLEISYQRPLGATPLQQRVQLRGFSIRVLSDTTH